MWIAEQWEWLKSFVSETDGKGSSRRLIELAIAWTFIFSYVRICLATVTFVPLDWTWAIMIAGILGLKSLDLLAKKKAEADSGSGNNT